MKKRSRWFVLGLGIVLAAGLLAFYAGWAGLGAGHVARAAAEESAGALREVPVALTAVTTRAFEERVVVQGNVEAKATATVSARLPGPIDAIYVDEGDEVVAGETKLFQMDALKVEKALDVRRQDLAVARCALREKEANLERTRAEMEKADIDLKRFERLCAQGAAPQDALEQQQSRNKQTVAMLKHAESLVDLGVEQLRQAESAVAISEKDARDATATAPISGQVTTRFREPGEMVGVGDPIVRIEDPKVLEVSAFLPAQYFPRVVPGTTPVRVQAYGVDAGDRVITYRGPSIHPKLRTFEVKCLLDHPPAGIAPGAMAQLDIVFNRREALGVPSSAVQLRAGKSVVFVIENNRARQVEVKPGLDSDGWTELADGGLAEGVTVATMGQFMLKDGSPVTVQQATGAPRPEGA